MTEYLGTEYVRAKHERKEAAANIGKEYVLKEDKTLSYMKSNPVIIPKGTKVKVMEYNWAYGYLIVDEKGHSIRTWTIND